MNILVVGSGAREHAIIKSLARSQTKNSIFCCATSNNPGIKSLTTDYWIGDITQVDLIVQQAIQWKIDFAIIGPEAPLEKGLADQLWKNTIPVIGPKQLLAQLETSKAFTRQLLTKYKIKGSPRYQVCHDLTMAKDFLKQLGHDNYVIKADGLMSGKGVKVAGDHLHSLTEAVAFCSELYTQGHTVVIEEKCVGQEFSLMCFCDGTHVVPMPLVQDHKRAYVNDKGPNTGGMGSYSDANHLLPFLTEDDFQEAMVINQQVIAALTAEFSEKYIGILYGSFIATKDGVRLIEYNARFGDPEAMNVLAILKTDLVDVCQKMLAGTLTADSLQFANLATVCKYIVPDGYPDNPLKNTPIDFSEVKQPENLFFAAIDERDGQCYATGSRALAVIGMAATIIEAEKLAEAEVRHIYGKVFHRSDIGTEELIDRKIQQMRVLRQCVV